MDKTTSRSERREHWRGVIGQWQASGESQAGFCRERGLAAWQFRYWLRRLATEGTPAVASDGFAEVSSPGWGLRLRLPRGLVLEVGPGFDEGKRPTGCICLARAHACSFSGAGTVVVPADRRRIMDKPSVRAEKLAHWRGMLGTARLARLGSPPSKRVAYTEALQAQVRDALAETLPRPPARGSPAEALQAQAMVCLARSRFAAFSLAWYGVPILSPRNWRIPCVALSLWPCY